MTRLNRTGAGLWMAVLLAAGLAGETQAAPYTPQDDQQVVERLPQRAAMARGTELGTLRARWRELPQDPERSADLALAYVGQAMAVGDPRFAGYAQAALNPWWTMPSPPLQVRLARGVLHQYDHRFAQGLTDLQAVADAQPDNLVAWSWLAAVHMVMADYARARQACERAAPLTVPLAAAACAAQVDSMTGQAAQAAKRLQDALRAEPKADPALRLWALTRLAEIQERLGLWEPAQAAFTAALAAADQLGRPDAYLLAAYADFLLDRGRPLEVVALLKDRQQADTLLLRLALASEAAQAPDRAALRDELSARFAAARAQGDSRHEREEARHARVLLRDPVRALSLAQDNFRAQREVADARELLQASLAASNKAAAEPALTWLRTHRVESVVLAQLAAQVAALPDTPQGGTR